MQELPGKRVEFHLTNDSQNRHLLFTIPGSLELAQEHGRATAVMDIDEDDPSNRHCPCCQNISSGKPYHIFTNNRMFSKYGTAYTVLFFWILFHAVAAFLIFLSSGVLFLILMSDSVVCAFHNCDELQFIERLKEHSTWLHLASFLGFVVFLGMRLWFDRVNRTWEEKYSRLFIKPSDFTVFVNGLGVHMDDGDVAAQVQTVGGGRPFAIAKVTRIFGMEYYNDLLLRIFATEQRIKMKVSNGKMTPVLREDLTMKLKALLRELDALIHQQHSYSDRLPFVGCAFITFSSELEKERFLQASRNPPSGVRRPSFKVRRAALPSDIIWDNYEPVRKSGGLQKAVFVFLAAFIIFLAFSNLLFVEYLGEELKHFFHGFESDFVSLISSVSVVLVNILLKRSLSWSTALQKIPVFSDSLISRVKKEVVAQFINTSLLVLVINLFYFESFHVVGEGKVLQTIFFVLTIDFLVELVIFLVDLPHLKKYFFRRRLEAEIRANRNKRPLFQYELNSVYERETFDICESITSAFNIFGMAAFYHSIFPLGMALAAFRLVCLYLMTKREFTARSKMPRELEFRFIKKLLAFSSIFVYQFALGYVVFDIIFFRFPNYLTLSMLGLLAVDALLRRKPKKDPAERLAETRNLFYADCQSQLYTDYDLKNPVTRKAAIDALKRLQPEVKSSYLNSANYEYFERLFETKEEESQRTSRGQSGISPKKPPSAPTTFEQADEHEIQKSYFKNVSNVIFGTAPTQMQRSVFMTERESLRTALR